MNRRDRNSMYTKYLRIGTLAVNFEEMLTSDNLLSLEEEIALLKARLAELLSSVDDGESPVSWRELRKKWDRFIVAVQKGDTGKQTDILYEIDDFINQANGKHEAWKEIQDISKTAEKLITAQHNIMLKHEYLVPIDQVIALMGMALTALREAALEHAGKDVAERIIADAGTRHKKIVGVRLGLPEIR